MKRNLRILGIIGVLVFALAGCTLFGGPDGIVGSWQQVSINGNSTVLQTVVTFTATTYTGSVAGVTANSGT